MSTRGPVSSEEIPWILKGRGPTGPSHLNLIFNPLHVVGNRVFSMYLLENVLLYNTAKIAYSRGYSVFSHKRFLRKLTVLLDL